MDKQLKDLLRLALVIEAAILVMMLSVVNQSTAEQQIEIEKVVSQPIVVEAVQELEEIEVVEPAVVKIKRERVTVSRSLPTEATGKFKSYMNYKTITNKSSKQWEMQQQAITDSKGFRKYNDKYMVAVGSYYATECGTELLITLEDGTQVEAIVGDLKQDRHTDRTNRYVVSNGNIVEFIVDTVKMEKLSKKMGDVSYSGLPGKIIKIEIVTEI